MAISRLRLGSMLIPLALAGCGTLPPTEQTPYLPPSLYGLYEDDDVGAINFAAWAFAVPARTRNNPEAAARAVVAVEYLAGELRQNPRWVDMSPLTKHQMVDAKADLRRLLGIDPATPPQGVVNALLAFAWNIRFGNHPAALQALTAPGFTRRPLQTLQILANMPYVQSANIATANAEGQSFPVGPR